MKLNFKSATAIYRIKEVMDMDDKTILRELAVRVAELASHPRETEKKDLWYKHNSLMETRPLVFCDPENGWSEIVREEDLKCKDPQLRDWEKRLRIDLFHGESMKDDRVIEAAFPINYVYKRSDWGMHETVINSESGGSYRWDAPLKDYHDIDKLSFPVISVDYHETNRKFEIASDIFHDILRVNLKGTWWWTLGLTQTLVFLRGLEQIMFDMYDYPNELHRMMAFLRDGHMAELDFLEMNGLLYLNNDNTYVGSGGFGFSTELPQKDFDGEHVRTLDMWGFAESQETVGVSPELFNEFIFSYQKPILERFGLNCYGCCEALNTRWEIVKQLPRLRRVSVSPWADLQDMANKLGKKYIYSMKPNPADIALPIMDEERIRIDLRKALRIARNCRLEIIMKDNNTIGNNPNNVITWCRIAKEEIDNMD